MARPRSTQMAMMVAVGGLAGVHPYQHVYMNSTNALWNYALREI